MKFLKIVFAILICSTASFAQVDTFKVMTYNVLNYGDNCQNPPSQMHPYLKQIIQFVKPDILGLVKMQSIKFTPTDFYNLSPFGFADTVEKYALNAAIPNTFTHCNFTNATQSSTIDVLFYNKHKFGFLGLKTLCINTEDFNYFKLFIQDTFLQNHHDTTFLYVVLGHTQSGNNTTTRDIQDTTILHNLKKNFATFPNIIYMGDFNTSTSTEFGYSTLVNNTDSLQSFYDIPFEVEHTLNYPINWGNSPNACPQFLTTSTRQSGSIPNSCGTSGGGKNWYDHILISNFIKNNAFNISYLPHSYSTVGNDGHRIGISVNDTSIYKNHAAPYNVLDAMFNFSNKYPVTANFIYTFKNSNPAAFTNEVKNYFENVQLQNPSSNQIIFVTENNSLNEFATIKLFDVNGKLLVDFGTKKLQDKISIPLQIPSGLYLVNIENEMGIKTFKLVIENSN